MASYNSGIRCQPRPYGHSHAGTNHFGRIQALVTQRTNLSFKTKNKTGVLNQPEKQHTINTTVQRSHRLVYTADFLKSIKCKVDHDEKYK